MSHPWENEEVPLAFTTAVGYTAWIIRGPSGSLNGYVRIPATNPLWKVDYSSNVPPALLLAKEAVLQGPPGKRGMIDLLCFDMSNGEMRAGFLFDVHGGITFSGTPKDAPAEGFYYGFDCAHAGDLSPSSLERYPEFRNGDEVYRTLEYVTLECESLARQLHQLEALTS